MWQDPSARVFHVVGHLEVYSGPFYHFRYDSSVVEGRVGFDPFPNFPVTSAVYESPDLFPFFANRVLSEDRPEYLNHRRALALPDEASQIDFLERSTGARATDGLHVFPMPLPDEHGVVRLIFPAHGVRHIAGAGPVIEQLRPGDPLELREDRENEYNKEALLIVGDKPVGWVPDFLLEIVRSLLEQSGPRRLTVEAANGPDVPYNLRLLCRLEVEAAASWRPTLEKRREA